MKQQSYTDYRGTTIHYDWMELWISDHKVIKDLRKEIEALQEIIKNFVPEFGFQEVDYNNYVERGATALEEKFSQWKAKVEEHNAQYDALKRKAEERLQQLDMNKFNREAFNFLNQLNGKK